VETSSGWKNPEGQLVQSEDVLLSANIPGPHEAQEPSISTYLPSAQPTQTSFSSEGIVPDAHALQPYSDAVLSSWTWPVSQLLQFDAVLDAAYFP
jgi:hypothetical protein